MVLKLHYGVRSSRWRLIAGLVIFMALCATTLASTEVKTGGRFLIGGHNSKAAYFNGLINDVTIYNHTLSDKKIFLLSALPSSDLSDVRLSDKENIASMRFFSEHNEPVEFQQSGRQLWLANRRIGIEFIQAKAGFYLSRIVGIAAGQDFLSPDSALSKDGLWQLVLRRDMGRDETGKTVISTVGAKVSSKLERNENALTLHLKWNGLAVAGEKDVLDVVVSVTVKESDPFSRWRINVTNRSETWGLWRVLFPLIRLQPIGGKPDSNHFIVPRTKGIITDAPFGKPFYSGKNYPGSLNMQFSALYDDVGVGLYLAMHDGNGFAKEFTYTPLPGKDTLEYKVAHLPTNLGYPKEDYRMAYDFCIGPFRGDWYDACLIYRAWSTKQQWCRQGPLDIRRDIPHWYKVCPIVLKANTSQGDESVMRARDQTLALLKFFEAEMPVIVYSWKQHFPEMTHYNKPGSKWKVPDKRPYPCSNIHDGTYPYLPALSSFSAACKAISKAGGHVKPYVCSRIYDQGLNENAPLADQAKPNVVRKLDGDIKFVEHGDVTWEMCYHTKWWQNRIAETITELIRHEHAGGIYFDTFYGGYFQCFDTQHEHPHGGGNHGYLGARKLSQVVRDAMKKADPESVMSGENPAETAIDLLDAFLYRCTIRPDDLPIFAAVYGDYICRYGMNIDLDSDGFYIQCATLFTEGAQIGRISVSAADYIKELDTSSKCAERMKFLRKIARYYRPEVGAKYLAYGQLLRPISFTVPDPMPTCSYRQTSGYKWVVTRPALMTGTFLSPDGDIGIFIVNISDTEIPFSFELTPDRYLVDKSINYFLTRIGEKAECSGQTAVMQGKIAWKDTVAAHGVIFLTVRPQEKKKVSLSIAKNRNTEGVYQCQNHK